MIWREYLKICYLPHQYNQQRQREKKRWIYPILLAMEAEYYRQKGEEVIWDRPSCADRIITDPEGIDFLKLPWPDRIFTKAFDKKYQKNGNFKYLPGTYIQAAGGCWHGKCTFCKEKGNIYQVRPVEDVLLEIQECKNLGFREVFDDSATFPTGDWLDKFCAGLSSISNIRFSCNMRLTRCDWSSLRLSGFRMLLFGIESANQKTLKRIEKGVTHEDIRHVIDASHAGLEPHIAVMFGYPWESDKECMETLRLVWYLLKKGYAKTAQASFYCVDGPSNEGHRKYVNRIYWVCRYPGFWINKIKDIHNVDDLKYFWRQIKEGIKSVF